MTTQPNKLVQFLTALIREPVQNPFRFFIFVFLACLGMTHWPQVKQYSEFWLEWSACLSANLLVVSITQFMIRKLIPSVTESLSLENIIIAIKTIATWMLMVFFFCVSIETHNQQYEALKRITNEIYTHPTMYGASMAMTVLVFTNLFIILIAPVASAYKNHIKRRKSQ